MRAAHANYRFVVLTLGALCWALAPLAVGDFDLMGAVGVWHLNEGEGAEAKDSSPSGNHGTLFRDPEWVDGRFGKALKFTGDNFVWVREATDLPEGDSPRTLMCHFKWTAVNDFADVAQWVNDSEVFMTIGPRVRGAMVALQISADGTGVYTFEDMLMFNWDRDTEWHHIAAVFPEGATTDDQFLLYFDGVLQEETTMGGQAGGVESQGGQLTIGSWTGRIVNFFNGIIDDVAVFPFALPAEDIASVAKRGLVRGQFLDVSPTGKLATCWATLRQ